MQSKLQELTDKIYLEGLEKGNQEAKSIVEDAKKEASEIISAAKKEAAEILSKAEKKSSELTKNTASEIQLSSKQALNALKQQITDVVNSKILDKATGNAFDTKFTQQIIETSLKSWGKEQTSDLSVLLPKKDEKLLISNLSKSVKNLLDNGLELKGDSNIQSGFQIAPKDGSYKVSFTEEDFNNFLKQYLRPKLIELLFEA